MLHEKEFYVPPLLLSTTTKKKTLQTNLASVIISEYSTTSSDADIFRQISWLKKCQLNSESWASVTDP